MAAHAQTMSVGKASMQASLHRRTPAPFKSACRPLMCRIVQRGQAQVLAAASTELNTELGFQTMRDGVKVAADESILTPRFYTTDFDQMEELFSKEINPYLDMEELQSCLEEFRNDYNQRHFVRNDRFKPAADGITGETRKIFIEFLERSCTAEFSGFLLYKELGRRLKKTNPAVAEMFALMSRDEARHAGFINKAMGDFNLALDLGFLTKNRKYTFFQPKFIIYATYLSEKIGYWRYICIYRHLQRNPEHQLYPMFEYFENWCQDENRHGDFLAACLKARPELVQGPVARLWSRFFCLSVYITMYLNDHSRTKFYEALGMQTKPFNQHVIIETNKSAERIFPEVPDVEHPNFFKRMDQLLILNAQIQAANSSSGPLATLQKWVATERLIAEMAAIFFMPTKHTGSFDLEGAKEQLQY